LKEITRRKIEAVIQSISQGAPVKGACKAAGLDYKHFLTLRKKDEALDARVLDAMANKIELLEGEAFKIAMNPDLDSRTKASMIMFLLKTQGGYTETRVNVNENYFDGMTDKKRKDLVKGIFGLQDREDTDNKEDNA
jgi:hypothetical protein